MIPETPSRRISGRIGVRSPVLGALPFPPVPFPVLVPVLVPVPDPVLVPVPGLGVAVTVWLPFADDAPGETVAGVAVIVSWGDCWPLSPLTVSPETVSPETASPETASPETGFFTMTVTWLVFS